MERLLLNLVRAGIYLVPLTALAANDVLDPDIVRSHVAWKSFALRMLVEVVFALWLVLVALSPRRLPGVSWILGSLAAFVSVTTLADLFGHDPRLSLWTNLERMGGLVGLIHYLAFFVIAASVLDAKRWRSFFHLSLAVCAAVCVEATLQWTGVVPLARDGEADMRLDARMGHPVPLAIYVQIHLFVAAALGVRAQRTGPRAAYAVLAVLFAAVLYGTGTRAAWVATGAGLGVAALCTAAASSNPRTRRTATWITLGGVAAAGVVALLVWFDPPFLRTLPALGRLRSSGEDASVRWVVWSIGWQGFLERPLLGWGEYNFSHILEKFYDPRLFGDAPWWDHPHNGLLGRLIDGGVLGFAAYVAIHAATLHAVWKADSAVLCVPTKALLTGALASYLVFHCTQPPFLAGELFLFAIWSYVHASTKRQASPADRRPRVALAAAAALVALPGCYFTLEELNVRHVRLAAVLHRDLIFWLTDDEQGLVLEQAMDPSSFVITDAREQALHRAIHVKDIHGRPHVQRMTAQLAIREMQAEASREPRSVRTIFLTGYLLNYLGLHRQAIPLLQTARKMSPNRPNILLELASALRKMERRPAAVELCREVVELAPDNRNARIHAAMGAVWGRDPRAFEEIWSGFQPHPDRRFSLPKKIVDALVISQWWDQLIAIHEPLLQKVRDELAAGREVKVPAIRGAWRRLAAIYMYANRPLDAAGLLLELSELDASFAERLLTLRRRVLAGEKIDLWPGRDGQPLK